MNDASFSANLFSLINPRDMKQSYYNPPAILVAVCRRCLQLCQQDSYLSTLRFTETPDYERVRASFFISNNGAIAAEREQYVAS